MSDLPDQKDSIDDAIFDDNAIRVELRRMVERFQSELLHKLAAAEDSFAIDAKAMPDVPDGFTANMHAKFELSRLKTERRFQAIHEFIDRP